MRSIYLLYLIWYSLADLKKVLRKPMSWIKETLKNYEAEEFGRNFNEIDWGGLDGAYKAKIERKQMRKHLLEKASTQ